MSDYSARFDGLADAYERHRPDYPRALFQRIVARAPSAPSKAVDVAAGTGIATARLREAVPANWTVEAIEPGDDMRRVLLRRFPRGGGVKVSEGRAEAMALSDESVALITAATAFHWFHPPAFFAEAARVLVPGGALAVIRNRRVEQPVLADFDTHIRSASPENADKWRLTIEREREIVSTAPGFEDPQVDEILWTRRFDGEGLVALYLTRSTVDAVARVVGREALIEQLRSLYVARVGSLAAEIDVDYRAAAVSVVRRA